MMIRHVVFFKFKPETSVDARNEALEGLRALPAKIDCIRTYEVGEDVLRGARSWDAVIVSSFNDLEALDVYAKHADHVAAAARIRAVCDEIGAVDYEY